ncbi:hypothetical protein TIFTF001_004257 [Ficus carica]|uniref:Secreted protein n=1 Tax=Ficus carica TaxID=3494 RepID=A0AA87ZK75_FICCA|nr:hypothetical protein TIFTF001_004257 [Ficus carica]
MHLTLSKCSYLAVVLASLFASLPSSLSSHPSHSLSLLAARTILYVLKLSNQSLVIPGHRFSDTTTVVSLICSDP